MGADVAQLEDGLARVWWGRILPRHPTAFVPRYASITCSSFATSS